MVRQHPLKNLQPSNPQTPQPSNAPTLKPINQSMHKNSKIYIAGHHGMVGSAIWRNLEAKGFDNLIGRTRDELDLSNQKAVADFFEKEKPEYVFLAAAKVGGIIANNTYRAEFIYENLQIQNNIIHQAYVHGVKKLMFLGSSCIYPKHAPQPMKEEYLLTGELEPTNEPYAVAKIAGIKMCEAYRDQYGCNFISVMPTNLYGPNDNYDLENSHVLPAMIRKMHLAKLLENANFEGIKNDFKTRHIENLSDTQIDSLTKDEITSILKKYGIESSESLNVRTNERLNDKTSERSNGQSFQHSQVPTLSRSHVQTSLSLWGSGSPRREFLYVEDMAEACVHLMLHYNEKQFVNIGCGEDISIRDLSLLVKKIVDFEGELLFDASKPDGTPRKLLDVTHLFATGWRPSVSLESGIESVYKTVFKK